MNIDRKSFGDDFHWGVSTAAYQIEGGYNLDGKGLSIWDVFTNTKGKIASGETGNVACDFYNRYEHDLVMMSGMNIPNYRFSISWSRIFPKGVSEVNHEGLDYYDRMIDFCLELGIEPWVTLYHWDLPYELEKKGGWTNREVVNWFREFVSLCVYKFGDRVKRWMVMNEPMAFTGAGYFLGIHAPGRKGLQTFLQAAHHATLCQAEGGRVVRALVKDGKVGTTFSGSHIEAASGTEEDAAAAVKIDALLNRMYLEPLLGLGYPTNDLKVLQQMEKYMRPEDETRLAFDMDFIGIQNYTREIIKHSYFVPFVNAQVIKAPQRNVKELTAMNWEVYPECIYEMLKKYSAYPQIKELIVTENGAAFPDKVVDGTVHDEKRTSYLQDHIGQVLKAKEEGVKVNGYFVWTFLDNFEWAEGYHPRFGLVHVDFATQKRIIKSSGKWYANFLKAVETRKANAVK